MTTVTDLSDHRWKRRLDRGNDKRTRATAHNLDLILKNDLELVGKLAFNEFTGEIVQRGPLPWGDFDEAGEAWEDHHAFGLAAYLSATDGNYQMNVSTRQVHEAVEAAARAFAFHPIRDWLDGLGWDGKRRLHRLFGSMIGGEDTAYTEAVSLIFLVQAVARIYAPGCKVDFMIVVEGVQGAGKSRLAEALFAMWCAVAMESPAHKDFFQALRGVWCVMLEEMDALSKVEVTRTKQVITTTSDRYRPSYGRTARTFPRQCIFYGSTNEAEYLRDATGARRFLPVRCGPRIDVDAIAAVREQLFAEARHLHATGFEWWRTPPGAETEQEERYEHDAWETALARWLDAPVTEASEAKKKEIEAGSSIVRDTGGGRVLQVTVDAALKVGLQMDYGRMGKPEQTRCGKALKRLGWIKRRASASDNAGHRPVFWHRSADTSHLPPTKEL